MIGVPASLRLGPLAVETEQRVRCIGVAPMERALAQARTLGHVWFILVGYEPYYARVGFSKLPAGSIRFPGPVDPARILGLSLQPGAAPELSRDVRRPQLDQAVGAGGAGGS